MADRYLLESGAPDGYLLEDSSGVLLLEAFELSNSAEGGSDGTTVTNANSGGASGDAFDSAILGGGSATPKFETDATVTGTMGYLLGTGTSDWIGWDQTSMPAGMKTTYGRVYLTLKVGEGPTYVVIGEQSGGSSFSCYLEINTAGLLAVNPAGGGSGSFATTLVIDTLYRIEWKLVSHASAGTVDVNLYAGHNVTPLETENLTARDTNGGDIQRFYVQHDGGPTNLLWVDDINTNSSAMPGPTGSDAVPGLSTRRRQPHVPMRDLDPWSSTGWRG